VILILIGGEPVKSWSSRPIRSVDYWSQTVSQLWANCWSLFDIHPQADFGAELQGLFDK